MRHFYTKGFIFSSNRCSEQSVSCLLTLNWSQHFIWWDCFQICSGNNNTLLLYAYEVTHLVNKGVTRPYVQEEARVLWSLIFFLWLSAFWKHPQSNASSLLCAVWENNLETFKNLFLWFNHITVFAIISWNHYTEILMNLGTKHL